MNSCEFFGRPVPITLKMKWEGCALSTCCFNPTRLITYIYIYIKLYTFEIIYIQNEIDIDIYLQVYLLSNNLNHNVSLHLPTIYASQSPKINFLRG